jgi:hypothetical protein
MRISSKRADREGWLLRRDVGQRLGMSQPTLNRRFIEAAGGTLPLRVARDTQGRWRLHPDDLDKVPRRKRGVTFTEIGGLHRELHALRDEVAELTARVAALEGMPAAEVQDSA